MELTHSLSIETLFLTNKPVFGYPIRNIIPRTMADKEFIPTNQAINT